MIKKIVLWFTQWIDAFKDAETERQKIELLDHGIAQTAKLADEYEKKIADANTIYTTVRSFRGEDGDKVFWAWVRSVFVSDEYRFLVFTLRENIIQRMTQTSSVDALHEETGMLKMLFILDSFLNQGLAKHDEQNKVQ